MRVLEALEKYNIIPKFICYIWYIFLPYIVSNIGLSRSIHKYTYIYIFVCILYCIFYISIHENTFIVFTHFRKLQAHRSCWGLFQATCLHTTYILLRI